MDLIKDEKTINHVCEQCFVAFQSKSTTEKLIGSQNPYRMMTETSKGLFAARYDLCLLWDISFLQKASVKSLKRAGVLK